MFSPTSRYYPLKTSTFTRPDGSVVSYVQRRFIPHVQSQQVLAEATVQAGDRIDLITARTIGDPEQFWRICDANTVLKPAELTEQVGRKIQISIL